MKTLWQRLSARFAALAKREKALVAGGLAVVVGLGGYTLWVEPAQLRASALKKQLAQQKSEMASLQAQVTNLKARATDPDAPTKAALADARARLSTTESGLRQFDGVLVPPQRMPGLLQALLARHQGLSLLSLRTLAPAPLIAPAAEKKEGKPGETGKKPEAATMPGGNIYKHGIEIKVAGSYPDLLAYLAELEKAPEKLLWAEMNLTVPAYPRSELTLTVYSLSLDASWLVL